MSKLYNIIDTQLGQYYEEGITLEEAKEHALRFVERGMLEADGIWRKGKSDDKNHGLEEV